MIMSESCIAVTSPRACMPSSRFTRRHSGPPPAARANGLRPVDGPFGDISDLAGFEAQALRSAALGCEGKWAIHPSQLEAVHRTFSPNSKEIQAAQATLHALDDTDRHEVEVFACGPDPMLRAVAALARSLQLPCQVCVEEYMACAVGGCAGCVVHVLTDQGPTMKRVCVDGPVFDAKRIYPV